MKIKLFSFLKRQNWGPVGEKNEEDKNEKNRNIVDVNLTPSKIIWNVNVWNITKNSDCETRLNKNQSISWMWDIF